MSFDRAGYPAMAAAATIAIATLATAVWRRSWFFWLLGYALVALALLVAWHYRSPITVMPVPSPQ